MENKILASVGGNPITSAEVDEFLADLGQRGDSLNNPQGRAMILKQLIDTKLLLLDAKRNLFEAEPEFRAQLAKVRENLLANYAAEKVIASAKSVKEEDVKKYYDENKAKFESGAVVNASHILVDTEELATELYEKIASGEITFEDLNSAKQALISQLKTTHDSPGAIEGYYAVAALSGLPLTPEDYIRAVEETTLEDVAEAARKVQLHTVYFLRGAV